MLDVLFTPFSPGRMRGIGGVIALSGSHRDSPLSRRIRATLSPGERVIRRKPYRPDPIRRLNSRRSQSTPKMPNRPKITTPWKMRAAPQARPAQLHQGTSGLTS